jgi:hypothetical protein
MRTREEIEKALESTYSRVMGGYHGDWVTIEAPTYSEKEKLQIQLLLDIRDLINQTKK